MKQTLILLIGIAMICILGCSSCKKNTVTVAPDNPYGLPNATQVGGNFLACRINGKNYIATAPYTGYKTTKAGFNGDTLGISSAFNSLNYLKGIGFEIYQNQTANQTYIFDSSIAVANFGTDSTCLGFSTQYTNSKAINGSVYLTKMDRINKIVSGTFSCTFPIPHCDTLFVTDGRFDFSYN